MWRTLFTLALALLLLVRAQPVASHWDSEIPLAAQTTIWRDYLVDPSAQARWGLREQVGIQGHVDEAARRRWAAASPLGEDIR
jgi:hypothetical protein